MAVTGGTRNLETGQIGGSSSARCKTAGPARIPAPSCLSRAIEVELRARFSQTGLGSGIIPLCRFWGPSVGGQGIRVSEIWPPWGTTLAPYAVSDTVSDLKGLGTHVSPVSPWWGQTWRPCSSSGVATATPGRIEEPLGHSTLNGEGLLIYMEGRPPREMATLHPRLVDGTTRILTDEIKRHGPFVLRPLAESRRPLLICCGTCLPSTM